MLGVFCLQTVMITWIDSDFWSIEPYRKYLIRCLSTGIKWKAIHSMRPFHELHALQPSLLLTRGFLMLPGFNASKHYVNCMNIFMQCSLDSFTCPSLLLRRIFFHNNFFLLFAALLQLMLFSLIMIIVVFNYNYVWLHKSMFAARDSWHKSRSSCPWHSLKVYSI